MGLFTEWRWQSIESVNLKTSIEFTQSKWQKVDWKKWTECQEPVWQKKKKKKSNIHTIRVPKGKESKEGMGLKKCSKK